jgi:hypothetical protein
MAAKPGLEDVIRWLEGEREKFVEQLSSLESGSLHIGQRVAEGEWEDTTPSYIDWLKEKIDEMNVLIAQHSLPVTHF